MAEGMAVGLYEGLPDTQSGEETSVLPIPVGWAATAGHFGVVAVLRPVATRGTQAAAAVFYGSLSGE